MTKRINSNVDISNKLINWNDFGPIRSCECAFKKKPWEHAAEMAVTIAYSYVRSFVGAQGATVRTVRTLFLRVFYTRSWRTVASCWSDAMIWKDRSIVTTTAVNIVGLDWYTPGTRADLLHAVPCWWQLAVFIIHWSLVLRVCLQYMRRMRNVNFVVL